MRSPPLVPGFDTDVYVVLDDFGQLGRAYRETDEDHANKESVIRDLRDGYYNNPAGFSHAFQFHLTVMGLA